MGEIHLNSGWYLRSEELAWGPEMSSAVLKRTEGWLKADLPCDVHTPLIENGIIKEPLEADHCFDSRWIEDKSWWFKDEFHVDEALLSDDFVELTMESLDAEADVFLNGIHLGRHRSANFPFHREIKEKLIPGVNILLVRVTSGLEYYSESDLAAFKKCVSTEKDNGNDERGDYRRIFVRKAQYVYGWDWCPRLATCGIMAEVRIESYRQVVIRAVHPATLKADQNAEILFEIEVENLHPFSTVDADVRLEVLHEGSEVYSFEEEFPLRSGINHIDINAVMDDARLWWPNGMGQQPLYTVKVSAQTEHATTEYPPFKFGIRTVAINQARLDREERLFAIEINGVRVFCKGGNWIPADSIYARVPDSKYQTLVSEAKEANFNMLRVWGGGIYNPDLFYQKCDEAGIMVWHDFMFACAIYPDNLEWFRTEVEREIDYQTRRLRNHPCIVAWSGNNENHLGFDEWWINEKKPSFLGGAYCYNQLAPRIVNRNCPEIPYLNGTPYGGTRPNCSEMGTQNCWNAGTMNKEMEKRITPEEYDRIAGKFVVEYGYIGPCRKTSIEKYHGQVPLDRGGPIWKLHNNTFEKETIEAGIAKHYIDPSKLDVDHYLLYAGLCQGLMLSYSLEAMRFKENCSGSIFWMYNDCWGEVGWSIIDYYLMRKISYYYVKRAFAPLKLIMREIDGRIKIIGINETPEEARFEADYGFVSLDGKKAIAKKKSIGLKPFSREIVLECDKEGHDVTDGLYYIKPLTSLDILPSILRSCVFKQLRTPAARLEITDWDRKDDNAGFTIRSDVYAHAVHFSFSDHADFSDDYFDLLPGESREIAVHNLPRAIAAEEIKAYHVRNEG